jgi:hypothetical protein
LAAGGGGGPGAAGGGGGRPGGGGGGCRKLCLAIFYIFTTLWNSRNQNLYVEVFMKITGKKLMWNCT